MNLKKFAKQFHKPADDLEELAQKADRRAAKRERDSRFGDLRTFKWPANSRTEFILLPPYSEAGHVHFTFWTHWNLGSDGKQKTLCPSKTYPEKNWGCPVCYALDLLMRNGVDPDQLQGWGTPGASEYTYTQVLLVDCDGEDITNMDYLPTVVRLSPSVADKLVGYVARYKERLWDPEGAILMEMGVEIVNRGGKDMPNYDLKPLPETIEMATDEETMEAIIDGMYNLEQLGFYTGEWNEFEFRQACLHACHLLDEMGYRKVPSWENAMSQDWVEDPDEIEELSLPSLPEELKGKGMKKAGKGEGANTKGRPRRGRPKRSSANDDEDDSEPTKKKSKARPSTKKKGGRPQRKPDPEEEEDFEEELDEEEEDFEEEDDDGDEYEEEEEEPSPPPKKSKKKSKKSKPPSRPKKSKSVAKERKAKKESSDIERDPDDMDPEGEEKWGFDAPRCFGHYDESDPACDPDECPYLDTCITQDIAERVT